MKKIIISLVSALFVFLFFPSCRKFVEIPAGSNLIVSSQVFSDSTDANSAVLGMYLSMYGNYSTSLSAYNGAVTIYTGLSADELQSTTGYTDEQELYVNAILSTSPTISIFWSNFYTVIYDANAVIEGLTGNKAVSATAANQFIGEAKVVRAFSYFNLINLYGAAPLITSTDYKHNATVPRTSIDSVYDQIIADLLDAEGKLSSSYPTNGRVRINSLTADALLARVYLYKKDWTNADKYASKVINSGVYSLESDLDNVFLSGSNEAIWQLLPVQQGYETAEGNFFIPSDPTVAPSYPLQNTLVNAFEEGDARRLHWVDSSIIDVQTYYYPYKYKLGNDGSSDPSEYYMVFRLAEQYLIRAEAEAYESKLTEGASDVNVIRSRANLNDIAVSNQTDLIAAIYHERQTELFSEWGHRWFDLKRTGQVDSVMGVVTAEKGGTWVSTAQLYPLYLYDLQKNVYLAQNPGYN